MGVLKGKQWSNILTNYVGLRSENNDREIKNCASYAMDMGVDIKDIKSFLSEPENWESRLDNTLKLMMSAENSNSRYLMIVGNSTGGTFEYPGCFPKCSAKPTMLRNPTNPTNPIIGISLNNTAATLKQWVLDNIPQELCELKDMCSE